MARGERRNAAESGEGVRRCDENSVRDAQSAELDAETVFQSCALTTVLFSIRSNKEPNMRNTRP